MQGYKLRANYLWVVGMLIVLFPNILRASDGQDTLKADGPKTFRARVEQQGSIAVISLNPGKTTSVSADSSVVQVGRWLENEKIRIIDSATLQSRLQARQASQGDPKVAAEFEKIEAVVAQGTEDFYYKGNEAALVVLKPVFDRGLLHMEVTSRNPQYVEQVFQAGLMLIRAYSGAGDPLLASEIAGKLAAYFPGKEPSLTLVPPDVVALWRSEVEKIAAVGTSVLLEYSAKEGCEARIHGVAVGTTPVFVQSDMNYIVSLSCGQTEAPLWRVRVNSGEKAQIPLVDGDMLTVSSRASDQLLKRREVEFGLKTTAYWAGIDTVLGVYADAADEAVVRFDRQADVGGSAQWIERRKGSAESVEASVDAMMLQAFPAVALARAETAETNRLRADADPWISDWVTPVLFVTGAAVATVGSVFLYDASAQATVMNCSPNAAIVPAADQCKGVREASFANSKEYYDEWDKVHSSRVIGYSSVGVGAALVGWGAWRLISGSGASKPTTGTDVGLWGGGESVGATARWRF